MRRLVLMRHAKAEPYGIGGDRARPLAPRGRSDAAAAGLLLARLNLNRAIVSSATRTMQTFQCLGLDIEQEPADWLYGCGVRTLLQRIGSTSPDVSGLLVIGHAPTIPGLAALLSELVDPDEADELASWFPTAAFAEFTFTGTWSDLAEQTAELQLRRVVR